ncbi:MAG: GspE/PulE family protein [Patescibacteria group bacterium]
MPDNKQDITGPVKPVETEDKTKVVLTDKDPQDVVVKQLEINREFQEKSALKQAGELGLAYINIGKTPLNPDFLKIIDIDTASKSRVIPFFKVGKKVRLAIEDPNNPDTKATIEAIKEKGFEVNLSLASHSGIDDALKIYDQTQKYKKIEIQESVEEKSIKAYEKEIALLSDLGKKLDTVTAEEGLNLLDIGAMKTASSDIHYEPAENTVILRFRIDGVLHKVLELKKDTYKTLTNQLKYASRMQLNITTIPQDGRYSFNYNEQKIGVRVSSIPTPYGESFVCRYLVGGQTPLTLEELGFQGLALTKLKKACEISHGMILSTGPTGSGKSTTLYSILSIMNSPENKIITLEDPVEYNIGGVTQSQIDEKRGYNFSTGLRAVLRQDPDVVMLGEIRDLETAETAAQAALTGHVLLSTLHTNSAIETIPRLKNMGLQSFMIAPSLDTIIAQRLLRKVCPHCVGMDAIPASAKKEFEGIINNLSAVNPGAVFAMPEKIAVTHGCDKCSQTGYKGRIVIAEVVTITNELRDLILNNASLVQLITAARKEGIMTMREDGFMKVAQGLTTLEEVYRVTNVTI